MEHNNNPAINDEELATVSGGVYLQVSQWRQFLSQSIIGPLDNLASSASGSDRAAVQGYIATLRSTCVPGAAVAEPVKNMWNSYNYSGRAAIRDAYVRTQLDQLLGSAYRYIIANT